MGRWHEERRRDPYVKSARKQGYRARSAYKLKELQQKHRILRAGDAVADLGCAPGGWSQVLVEVVGPDGVVVGVDLQRTRPVEGASFIQGDFTQASTRDELSALLADHDRARLDAVVSDMAPDMTGNYDLDQARSVHLCRLALDFAAAHLKEGGHFVCKVFEGADFPAFREDVKACFRTVRMVHPEASRKTSSEVFMVARGFKGRAEAPEPEPEAPKERPAAVRPRRRAQDP